MTTRDLDEIRAVTRLPVWVTEVGASSFGADEVQSFGLRRTAELLVGLYETALPALDAALARHKADTNPLTDAPSVRVCRFARIELADMIEFGRAAIARLVDATSR